MYKEQRCIAILQIHKKMLEDTGLLLASRMNIVLARVTFHAYTLSFVNKLPVAREGCPALMALKTVSLIKVYQSVSRDFLVHFFVVLLSQAVVVETR